MNTYIKTLLDSFGNQLFPRTRVDAVYLEDNTTELGDHLQTKQDVPTLDKTTPVDGDKALIYDSADSNVAKKLSWANIKATLKTYFDTLYPPKASPTFTGTPIAPTAVAGTNTTQIATTAFVQQEVATPTTLTHTQTESIKSLPTGSLDGKVNSFKADGLSLVNSVVNGDFINGTTGWSSNGSVGTLSITNNELTHTITNVQGYAGVTNISGSRFTILPNNKYYITYEIKPFRTHNPSYYFGGSYYFLGSDVTANQWNKVAQIRSISSVNNDQFIVSDNGSSGTGMVIGSQTSYRRVQVINLTALFGTGNEPTKEKMDDLLNGVYFDGLKGVENPTFESVGKNLFDKNDITIGKYVNSGGSSVVGSSASNHSNYIKIKQNANYVRNNTGTVAFYDINYQFISYANTNTFTTPINAVYLRFNCDTSLLGSTQLEEGTVATAYEAYKSSALSINETLRSLPNGIKDRVFEQDGQIWLEKNVAEYVLKSADVVISSTAVSSSVDIHGFNIIGKNSTTDKDSFICGTGERITVPALGLPNDVDHIGKFYCNTTNPDLIRVVVAKGQSLATTQSALAGTKIHYQLATPQLINLTTLGKANGELSSFANGTSYLGGDTFHVSSVEFTTPANVAAALKSLAEGDNYQAKQIAMAITKTSDTGAAKIPAGTTEQRDATPIEGMIRFNSTLDQFEGYFNGSWQSVGGGQLLGTSLIKAISYNAQVINENITIPSNYNAMSVGPITIGDGYTLTIEDGAVYKVI